MYFHYQNLYFKFLLIIFFLNKKGKYLYIFQWLLGIFYKPLLRYCFQNLVIYVYWINKIKFNN